MARSVNIYFTSNINQTLNRQSYNTTGTWVTAPPQTIPPTTGDFGANPINWKSESIGGGDNAGGMVTYSIGSTSQSITMTWASQTGKVNSYSVTGSSSYELRTSGTDGDAAVANYVLSNWPGYSEEGDETEGEGIGE